MKQLGKICAASALSLFMGLALLSTGAFAQTASPTTGCNGCGFLNSGIADCGFLNSGIANCGFLNSGIAAYESNGTSVGMPLVDVATTSSANVLTNAPAVNTPAVATMSDVTAVSANNTHDVGNGYHEGYEHPYYHQGYEHPYYHQGYEHPYYHQGYEYPYYHRNYYRYYHPVLFHNVHHVMIFSHHR